MADDHKLRSHRLSDPYRHSADPRDVPSSGPAEDPLAELVRLIGQQPDQYTDNGRGYQRQGLPPTEHLREGGQPDGDWRREVDRPQYEMRDTSTWDTDPLYGADPHALPRPSIRERDPYLAALPRDDNRYGDDSVYPDGALRETAARHGAYAGDQSFGRMDPPSDDDYDDPPRRKRSSALVTAVVLIGCAMLGTAGAYGYRTYSGSASTKPAPVIVADTSPNKIVPSAERKTTRSQDRVGAQGNERLVSREEQPVAMASPGNAAVPRVVLPAPVQNPPTVTGGTSTAPGGSLDQPRPVRTFVVRSDAADTGGMQTPDSDTRAAAPPSGARPAPNARTASAPTTPPPAPRPSRDQPLSLDPSAPTLQSAPQRPAAPAAPRETAAPPPAPRVAAIPTAGGDGGFLVQLSSQRSESEAQASFRALQAKYSQLKSRQVVIRRADLGAKGIYFRAMVGPFESLDEASQFCGELRQAGGQCIIPRN
jgi:SPOR domain